MEMLRVTAPIAAALIAAFLGSLLGALFKEQISDIFYVQKRKREIKAAVSKEIIMFLYQLIHQMQILNLVETLKKQCAILNQDRSLIEDPKEIERYTKEIFRLTDVINEEVERNEKLFLTISEIQGNIHQLVIESTHYKRKNVRKLKRLLKEIQSERHTRNIIVDIYNEHDLSELIKFRENDLPKLLQQKTHEKEQKIDYYIDSINALI